MLVKLQRFIGKDVFIVLLISLLFGVFLHWKTFVQADRFHDNWRQSPHWTDPQNQQFHPDDLLIRYAHFNTSPFADILYKTLAHTGIDIFWGKVNAVLFFAFAVISVFVAGRAAGDRVSGWIATILFLFFPCVFKNFVGGFMSGLSGLFPGVTIYIIFRKKWWWAVPLLSLEAFIYPMVAVQSGIMFVCDYLFHDVKKTFNVVLWKTKFLPLLLAAVISFSVMSMKYSGT
ncbi:MAG: hypothetical protein GY801_47695, partial [bacterium]|nr:hypothetical protein [bacterium]